MRLYIYDNETGEEIATIEGDSNEECEQLASEKCGINDVTWSYQKMTPEQVMAE